MSLANELTASKKLAPAILPVCVRNGICTLSGAAQPAAPPTAVIVNSSSAEQVGLLSYYCAGTPTNFGTTSTQIAFTAGGDGSEILDVITAATGGSMVWKPNGCVLTRVPANTSAPIVVNYGTGSDFTPSTLVILWTPLTPVA